MSTTTPKLGIVEVAPSQSQPEVPINAALRALEMYAQLTVINSTTTAPPGSPADGDAYIVAASPTGVWTGHAKHIAYYSGTAWKFLVPKEGWIAYDAGAAAFKKYVSAAWASASI